MKTMELREFIQLLQSHGCSIERLGKSTHFKILNRHGKTVTYFAILHGKHVHGEPVLEVYVKRTLKMLREQQ